MVWHMKTGDRVLDEVESRFYLGLLQDSFRSTLVYNDWEYNLSDFNLWGSTGNVFFDKASFNQQIFLINFCLNALLKPEVPMPELNHLLEAAAYYPFGYLEQMVWEELEGEKCLESQNQIEEEEYVYRYRRMCWEGFDALILPDLMQYEKDNPHEEPLVAINPFYGEKYKSKDLRCWEDAIADLADIIFWDRDWFWVSSEPQLLDGMEQWRADSLGITEQYFTNRLPKVTDQQAIAALQEIMEWEL
ncbi:hypothetical protein K4A83_06225 [Spirulina subsalsa FACHB-351]|uniref:Uncharacterized protein n=1 Tax=Spirulina subsalsa FACHB-351 TaxID=234711 RepID=A0ABT3L2Y8_9CYAN|nr:hypothetical protein [Spirulina subsalsa]MCW6035869.1 hypothetical protein [Spirulina subsalsa FACHB-351]